jgi:HAD superfamily hydrolase (TIGR01509 family)
MRLQAIVFDYDGVLADTEPLHLRAFQQTLAPSGIDLPLAEYMEQYLGLDDLGVFRAVSERNGLSWDGERLARLVADKADRFRQIVERAALPWGTPERVALFYPGVTERLRAWSERVPLAIASGSLRSEIEPILEAEGLRDVVPVIVAAGETANGKPLPDPYLRALTLLAERRHGEEEPLDASRCVAIEDSPWGIDAAVAAGMRVIAVATSYPRERLGGADVVVRRFEDLDLRLISSAVSGGGIRGDGSGSPSL